MKVDFLGTSLEFNTIGLDGSSRLVGRVPNPLADRPEMNGVPGYINGVVVGEAGHAGIVLAFGDDIWKLAVYDLQTGTKITTADNPWFAFGPGDRLAIGIRSPEHPMTELVTYELADPSAAPGLVSFPRDVQPVGWEAGDEVGLVGFRTIAGADEEVLVEVGVLRAGTFTPGQAELHFRTGIERPELEVSRLAEAYERIIGSSPEVGGDLRHAALDPAGTGGWLLVSAADGTLLLARLIEPQDPVVVARLAQTANEEGNMRILGIAPDGSRVAVGMREFDGPTARTHLVDARTGAVSIYPGTFAGWADTP